MRHSARAARISVLAALVVAFTVVTGCAPAPAAPEGMKGRAAEFAEKIKPVWTIDDQDVFGDPVASDGVVAYYTAADEALTLHVADAATGEKLWTDAVSPAGEFNVPLFDVGLPQARKYDTPAPTPLLVRRGEGDDAQTVIVYFRPIDGQDTIYDRLDGLVVAEVRSGDEVTIALDDEWKKNADSYFSTKLVDGQSGIEVVADSPAMVCGDGPLVCWVDWDTYALLDLDTLTIKLSDSQLDYEAIPVTRESIDRTPRLANRVPDGTDPAEPAGWIVGMDVSTQVWQRGQADLFGLTLTAPAFWRWPLLAGGGAVAPGYEGLFVDRDIPTVKADFAASRSAVAIELATGETRWTVPGGDPLCYAVVGYPVDADADVVPMCLVKDGGFDYTPGQNAPAESPDTEVSIVGVNADDGSIAWEIEHAGDASLERINYIDTPVFRGVGRYTVAATAGGTMLIDLKTGETEKLPKDALLMCQVEYKPVPLEPMRRFDTGEFGPGMAFDPCRSDGSKAVPSRGSVRLIGDAAGGGMVVVRSSDGLAGFDLSQD